MMKPNLRPTRGLQPVTQPVEEAPLQNVSKVSKPFERPASGRRDQPPEEQKLRKNIAFIVQAQAPRRTPVNGFRKFNPLQQQAQPQVEASIVQQYMNGPEINIFKQKAKIDEQTAQINQQELRQKVQVKIQQKPLQPSFEITETQVPDPEPKQLKKKTTLNFKTMQGEEPKQSIEQTETQQIQKEAPKVRQTLRRQPGQQTNTQISQQTQKIEVQETQQFDEPEPVRVINKNPKQEQITKQQQREEQVTVLPQKFNNQQVLDDIPPKMSQSKVQIQKQRIVDLQSMITLEIDDYSNQLNLQPRTPYELYLDELKNNRIRNSNDQTQDDAVTIDTQTDTIEINDFGNQCPEDQHRTYILQKKQAPTTRLIDFIESACKVVEEILNLGIIIQQNVFDDFEVPYNIKNIFKCQPLYIGAHGYQGNQLFITQCFYIQDPKVKFLKGSIVIIYPMTTILFTPSQLTSIAISGGYIVGGTSDGHIIGWHITENNSDSNRYVDLFAQHHIKVKFMSFSSEWNNNIFDQFSDQIQHQSPISEIKFRDMTSVYEFITSDVFGQILIWQLQDLNFDQKDRLYVELGIRSKVKLILVTQLVSSSQYSLLTISSEMILVSDDSKVRNLLNNKSYYSDHSRPTAISNSTEDFFYVGYLDGQIRIYYAYFSDAIHSLQISNKRITHISNLGKGIAIAMDIEYNLIFIDLEKELFQPIDRKSIQQRVIQIFIKDQIYVITEGQLLQHQRFPLPQMPKRDSLKQLLSEYQ